MMTLSSVAPAGEDWTARRFADIERRLGELTSTLTRAGLLGNNVLASPVVSAAANEVGSFDESNASPRMLLSVTVDVPKGFSTALTIVTATISGYRGAGAFNSPLKVGAVADPDVVSPISEDFAPSSHGSVSSTAAAKLSGVSGAITLGAFGNSGSDWQSGSGGVTVSALVLFTK